MRHLATAIGLVLLASGDAHACMGFALRAQIARWYFGERVIRKLDRRVEVVREGARLPSGRRTRVGVLVETHAGEKILLTAPLASGSHRRLVEIAQKKFAVKRALWGGELRYTPDRPVQINMTSGFFNQALNGRARASIPIENSYQEIVEFHQRRGIFSTVSLYNPEAPHIDPRLNILRGHHSNLRHAINTVTFTLLNFSFAGAADPAQMNAKRRGMMVKAARTFLKYLRLFEEEKVPMRSLRPFQAMTRKMARAQPTAAEFKKYDQQVRYWINLHQTVSQPELFLPLKPKKTRRTIAAPQF